MKKGNINIDLILEGCRNKNRLSQQRLYEHFYGYDEDDGDDTDEDDGGK